MNGSHYEEQGEVLVVSLPNAGANPGTMVVVDLNAGIAGAAVKRSGWAEDAACWASGNFYHIFHSLNLITLLFVSDLKQLELLGIVE